MKRIKYLVAVLVLLVAVLLEPIAYDVYAEEYVDLIDRRDSIPKVNDSAVKLKQKTFLAWRGFLDGDIVKLMENFVFTHRRLKGCDYSQYDLVCDFELKAQNVDGSLTTSSYCYSIDLTQYETGFFDSILIGLNLKDDYYEHVFSYRDIVKNAVGFYERDIFESKLQEEFTYNTVISQADFYFVRKSDGKKGQARRFTFVWDSDFYQQKCTKISFSWYDYETEIEKEISSVEDETGVDGYNEKNSWLDNTADMFVKFGGFLVDIPKILYVLVTNIVGTAGKLLELSKSIFPFIPGIVFDVFGVLVVFALLIALWKIVKGG